MISLKSINMGFPEIKRKKDGFTVIYKQLILYRVSSYQDFTHPCKSTPKYDINNVNSTVAMSVGIVIRLDLFLYV